MLTKAAAIMMIDTLAMLAKECSSALILSCIWSCGNVIGLSFLICH